MWVTVVSPKTGTSVLINRKVQKSSRGGKYVQYAGMFYKLNMSGSQGPKIKFGSGRDNLP